MDCNSFFEEDPAFIAAMKVRSASSYDVFVQGVYEMLEFAKDICQSSLDVEYDSGSKEDSITINLKNYLIPFRANISMEHVNGNADFVIQDDRRQFRWIGEAKILGDNYSNNHLFEGVLQLATRYSSGGANEQHGGLLIYNFKGKMSDCVSDWREYFLERAPSEEFDDLEVKEFSGLKCCDGFFSQHSHHGTGNNYVIAHIPINFYQKPLDKSGKKSRAKEKR